MAFEDAAEEDVVVEVAILSTWGQRAKSRFPDRNPLSPTLSQKVSMEWGSVNSFHQGAEISVERKCTPKAKEGWRKWGSENGGVVTCAPEECLIVVQSRSTCLPPRLAPRLQLSARMIETQVHAEWIQGS